VPTTCVVSSSDFVTTIETSSVQDGSGTVNAMEIFRALVNSTFKPATPVEFHFYSGEEAGLKGSQAIALHYNQTKTKVKAFMELDMTA